MELLLLARDLARCDGLTSGLVGIWSVVERCLTYFVRRDREQKKLVLRLEPGKCLHYYFYFLHERKPQPMRAWRSTVASLPVLKCTF